MGIDSVLTTLHTHLYAKLSLVSYTEIMFDVDVRGVWVRVQTNQERKT